MYYVYILKSLNFPNQRYVGYTTDIKKRLIKHNNGEVPHSSKFKPWKIQTCIVFSDKQKAINFEKYLKSGSGTAFRNKRF